MKGIKLPKWREAIKIRASPVSWNLTCKPNDCWAVEKVSSGCLTGDRTLQKGSREAPDRLVGAGERILHDSELEKLAVVSEEPPFPRSA